ncbi:UPF0496 protein At3g49070 [Populus alba]|uniref:Uncharacterized protein n=1 Tax=Populus alba x Populus x berolinensis TaxID=444605 RepID=A0AAD6LRG5_9ROSI|nr:UPF0496 protein At3g49070 [Populus alba]XP_034924354.1 UPF0496 protein At3g49070 [Populus alba]XP_034924355.1 UPF0496 protein At3g49070 [Populus alba]KAJ6971324.1 hypothetical protein NC653_035561 [Populus alba x Populus x berolinensis]
MKKRIGARIKEIISCSDTRLGANSPKLPMEIDVREEYANAFRTESYNLFWARLQAVSNRDPTTCTVLAAESTTSAARLPSYRLFVENLLDPDQPTVIRTLSLIHTRPSTHSLLSKYFTQTANASLLCGLLLKDMDHIRVKYRSLKATLDQIPKTQLPNPEILARITEFVNARNPFDRSGSTPSRVQVMQADCFKLLKQLESKRDKAKAKLNLKNKLKHSSAVFLVALTASLTIIIATHALALLVAAPGLITATSLGPGSSTRRLARVAAQLDAAAKGTYTLSRDLETISRLVNRVKDEMEHMHSTVKYLVGRGNDEGNWLHGINGELVVRQFSKINECCSFSNQVDDLEEHLYLCFLTINRARNLVLKEILDPGQ